MVNIFGAVVVTATFATSLAFCVMYHLMSKWWKSDFGRSLMIYQISMTAVLGLSVLRNYMGVDHPSLVVVGLIVFSVVPIALTWRLIVLIKLWAQRGDS